jgi:hypothetical protein
MTSEMLIYHLIQSLLLLLCAFMLKLMNFHHATEWR